MDIRRVFADQVKPLVFADAVADAHPLTVFFGGQPGAGKTMGQRRIEAMHPDEHLVKIIGDDLRQFHPDYTRLVEEAPLDMPSATAHASGM